MDPDQDLLNRLEDREIRDTKTAAAVIGATSVLAGLIGYFSLTLELHTAQEASLDSSGLIAIAAAAMLFVAYRKIK